MIIHYDIDTGKIVSANYGLDDDWTDESITEFNEISLSEGLAAAKVEDSPTWLSYYDASDETLKAISELNITPSKTLLSADSSDYIEFTGVPEGTKVYVDDELIGEMDSSGIYRFSCSDAGTYRILMKKLGYNWYYMEAFASVNFD